jgi:hypothetical protein
LGAKKARKKKRKKKRKRKRKKKKKKENLFLGRFVSQCSTEFDIVGTKRRKKTKKKREERKTKKTTGPLARVNVPIDRLVNIADLY